MSRKILVTGASGPLGTRVLHHLRTSLAVPAERIIAASRSPERLAEWAARGIETRVLDFDDQASFAAAFAGIDRALLISTDALDQPGRRLAQHKAAIAGLERAEVGHVVYTSAPNPEGAPLLIAPDHAGTEAALAASRLAGWTVLRNHWYYDNLPLWLQGAAISGVWYSADHGGKSADISRDDLALAAATVLAGDTSGKTTFTLSGPEALTKAEIAQQVSAAIGKSITVAQVSPEALLKGMVDAGMPKGFAQVMVSFEANTAIGRVETVTGDFEALTGRKPLTLGAWLAKNPAILDPLR